LASNGAGERKGLTPFTGDWPGLREREQEWRELLLALVLLGLGLLGLS
jgi:hypothetical protein